MAEILVIMRYMDDDGKIQILLKLK